jgi:hypothetical protein
MNNEQHQEDTKYVQWQDGMYVMLDDLADPLDEQEYVLALVEDSLRGSVYFNYIEKITVLDNSIGVLRGDADYWATGKHSNDIKLTRSQALYIATGDTDI